MMSKLLLTFVISLASPSVSSEIYGLYEKLLAINLKYKLHKEASSLNGRVINKVVTALKCAKKYNIEHKKILTIVDYSLPSSTKRLWVFDLKEKKLLFHTYVSHGLKSGEALANYFSNKNDSKASSIGVYKTEKNYFGRDGLSLRLEGLDRGFNNNAFNRAVVMHGGWYVDEDFIKKYGRAGRSWGCPSVPLSVAKPLIETIKDQSLFVIYYPNKNWFFKSKFLNCGDFKPQNSRQLVNSSEAKIVKKTSSQEEILFADLNNNNKREENEPVIAMAADTYAQIFNITPPLSRMLRRQINEVEYIALNSAEFKELVKHNYKMLTFDVADNFNAVYFVIPVVKMQRGYYKTEMKIINLGKIKDIRLNMPGLSHQNLQVSPSLRQTNSCDRCSHPCEQRSSTQYCPGDFDGTALLNMQPLPHNLVGQAAALSAYTIDFVENPSIILRPYNRFIRWLGL